MNKTNFSTVKLNKGEVNVYDFGAVKLHAYKTNDMLSDEVFILEKDGKSVVIESPCFFDNETELEKYVGNLNVQGLIVAYHAAGGAFLKGVKKYATASAKKYSYQGGGKALIDNFTKAFGAAFDSEKHVFTDVLSAGETVIAGIKFIIIPNDDAFTIEIPEINAVYTHMLGHDCHSIVAGAAHADAMIAELSGYIEKGVTFVLTSHYTPEDLKDAETKINYLKDLKSIAGEVKTAEEFKNAINTKYPRYSGENYLEMTANMFFN